MSLATFDQAYEWLTEGYKPGKGGTDSPAFVLGNGFSIAFDPTIFSYAALRMRAVSDGLISDLAGRFFDGMRTVDFEVVIKSLLDASRALRIIRNDTTDSEAAALEQEAAGLKETLARTLAGLHPDRPHEITDDAYLRVYNFIARFHRVYTLNYDLLLYWTVMRGGELSPDVRWRADDGFRENLPDETFVSWDDLHASRDQTIRYIHGALHLFWGDGLLRKLTYSRTGDALLDQIRAELNAGRFRLYVAEGSSAEKMARIDTSLYLGEGLKSLANLSRGVLTYGLSFSANDEHLLSSRSSSRGRHGSRFQSTGTNRLPAINN